MNISDLWIGDRLLLKKSGRIGKFEGVSREGKLKINVDGAIILTGKSNVEVVNDDFDNLPEQLEFDDEELSTSKPTVPKNEPNAIDLHLEKLDPLHTIPAIRALDFQIEQCKQFLDKSILNNYSRVIIIHGKGSGILKISIKNLLQEYDQVYFTFDINKGGATEVWLR